MFTIRRSLPAAVVLLVLSLSACSGAGAGAADLADSRWVLTSINGSAPLAGTTITLEFTRQNGETVINGSAGCNSYGGGYQQNGVQVSFGQLASTLMACEQPVMDQEAAYMNALGLITEFSLEGGQLALDREGVSLIFNAVPRQ